MTQEALLLMSKGDAFLKEGHLQQAQTIYQEVTHRQPDLAEAYFKLAWIADKEGKVLSARKQLNKAHDKDPLNKTYLSSLATLCSKTGKIEEALSLYRNFLKIDQRQDDIYFAYALLLIDSGQFKEAIEALKKSINLNPGKLAYYMKLGELLFHLSRFPEALELYKQAYDKGLQSEGLYLNLAKLYTDFGKQQAAKEVLARGMIFYPRKLSFPYRLQSIDKLSLKEDFYQALAAKEAKIPEQEHFYFHWLLAQHENIKGAPLNEMSHLLKAHEAFKKLGNFKISSEAYTRLIQHLLQLSVHPMPEESLVPDENAAEELAPLSSEASPIFIVGIPRCGSTLLENIICSGPTEIKKGEETGIVFHCASNILNEINETTWERFKAECDAHYQRLGLSNSDSRFTDKSLENIFMIDLLLALYPNAKIIYCDRNPLATIVSILRNNLVSLPWAHDLESILEYVDISLKTIDAAIKKHPERILSIRYETLVAQAEQESKKLMQFCELPWNESCLDVDKRNDTYSKTASHIQVRNEINTDSIELYKQYQNIFKEFEERYAWLKQD